MYKAFATVLCLLFFQSCQKFSAINNPEILTSFSQNESYPISKVAEDSFNAVRLQETFSLPKNCSTLSLADLFGIAICNNPSISQSWQESKAAASRYSASLSQFLPTASFLYNANGVRANTPFDNLIGTERYWKWGPQLNLSYLLFDFGKRGYSSDVYYSLLQSANLQHKQMLQNTLKNIANQYYNYIYSTQKLEADIADRKNYEEDLKAAEKKALLGIVGKSDVLLAKSKFLHAKIVVVQQETFKENAFISLVKAVGINPTAKFSIKGFDEEIVITNDRPEKKALVELAKKQRPDYLQSKALVLSKEARYKSLCSEHLPSINMDCNMFSNNYSTGLRSSNAYDINFSLNFPLFTGFLVTNQTREARSDLKSAISSLRSSEIKMIQELYTAYNNVCSFEKQLMLSKEYLETSKQEHAIILEKYRKGVATILDLLQASSSLADARAQWIGAKKGYFSSAIDLSHATGSLINAKK